MNNINAFAVTHKFYLDQLKKTANDWASAPDDEKREQAIKSGKSFVSHAKQWSKVLNTSILNTKDAVNIMTAQLHDVKSQLVIQLQLLKDKLSALQNTLKVQEDALDELRAAFWGSLAATLFGLVVLVMLFATGVGSVLAIAGAGFLFIGGLVTMLALSIKVTELARQVSQTKSQIDVTNTAISQLSSVVANFTELDSLYGVLNMFWGRMGDQANTLGTMDDVTAMMLCSEILEDTSSIDAALSVTAEISGAALTYLDVLNKQGIDIPDELTVAKSHYRTMYLPCLQRAGQNLETQQHAWRRNAETGDTVLKNPLGPLYCRFRTVRWRVLEVSLVQVAVGSHGDRSKIRCRELGCGFNERLICYGIRARFEVDLQTPSVALVVESHDAVVPVSHPRPRWRRIRSASFLRIRNGIPCVGRIDIILS